MLRATASSPQRQHLALPLPCPLRCHAWGAADGRPATSCFLHGFLPIFIPLRQPTISTTPVYYSWPTLTPPFIIRISLLFGSSSACLNPAAANGPVCTLVLGERRLAGITQSRHTTTTSHPASSDACAASPDTASQLATGAASEGVDTATKVEGGDVWWSRY